ncbi:hypothetical protein ACFL0Y_00480 [Patescibacteria group bacterium]
MIDKAFFILLGNQFLRFWSFFKHRQWPRILVMIIILVFMFILAIGIFFFSYTTFSFFGQYQDINQPIVIYSLAITFILTFVLTFFSSLITALGTLFQRDDNRLIFSWPIEIESIFELRLIDTALLSSWPLLTLTLPVIFGYGFALNLSLPVICLFILVTLFLALSATLLGVLLATLISRPWGNLKSKTVWLGALGIIPFLGWGLIQLLLPSKLTQNLGQLEIAQISQLLDQQFLMNPFLPTTWAVKFVSLWPLDPILGMRNWFFLFGFFTFILIALLLVRGKFYRKAVDKTAVGRFIAAPWDKVYKKAKPFPYLLKGKFGALTEKDWLVIFRSSPQLFQLGFIVFLQLVYFLVINRVPAHRFGQVFENGSPIQLILTNFLFVNFLASVLAMRFFFPMISLEGHSSWIIWSAPIKRIKIFWQKFLSSFLVILAWMTISTLFSIKSLGLPFGQYWFLFLINLPLGLTLVMITLGVGTLKPNFWEKNPEKLSTTPGGILATFLCLAYTLCLSLGIFFLKEVYALNQLWFHLFSWLVSGLVFLPILKLIPQKINQYEM